MPISIILSNLSLKNGLFVVDVDEKEFDKGIVNLDHFPPGSKPSLHDVRTQLLTIMQPEAVYHYLKLEGNPGEQKIIINEFEKFFAMYEKLGLKWAMTISGAASSMRATSASQSGPASSSVTAASPSNKRRLEILEPQTHKMARTTTTAAASSIAAAIVANPSPEKPSGNPPSFEYYTSLRREFESKEKWQEALNVALMAAQTLTADKFQERGKHEFLIGKLHQRLGNIQVSKVHLTNAINILANHNELTDRQTKTRALYYLSECYSKESNWHQAIIELNKAKELISESFIFWDLMARKMITQNLIKYHRNLNQTHSVEYFLKRLAELNTLIELQSIPVPTVNPNNVGLTNVTAPATATSSVVASLNNSASTNSATSSSALNLNSLFSYFTSREQSAKKTSSARF